MYIIYHPWAKITITLTDSQFRRLKRLIDMGLTHPSYFRWLMPFWREFYRQYPWDSWVEWVIYAVEVGWYEKYTETRYYRLQCACLFYTDEAGAKTPMAFLETRAWTIVAEATLIKYGIKHIMDKLELEALYLPFLIGSLYRAFFSQSVSAVKKKKCSWLDHKILLPIANIVELPEPTVLPPKVVVAYEVRDIDGDADEITVKEANCARERICRGIAVYKVNNEDWRNPYVKYTEKWITGVELLLEQTDTIREFRYGRFKGLKAFKMFCRDKMLDVMYYLDINAREMAYRYGIEPVEDVMDRVWDEIKTKELITFGDLLMAEAVAKYNFPRSIEITSFERGVEL